MSRKSKREIERELEDLQPNHDDDPDPIVISMAHFTRYGEEPTWDTSPHPELTVPQHEGTNAETLTIAVPKIIPEPYCNRATLPVVSCVNQERHTGEWMDKEQEPVTACELWEALDDDDLKREKSIREENGDPIPDLLAGY